MASSCLERHLIPPLFLLFWQTDARKGTKDENFFFFHLHDIESQDCHFFFFFFLGDTASRLSSMFFFFLERHVLYRVFVTSVCGMLVVSLSLHDRVETWETLLGRSLASCGPLNRHVDNMRNALLSNVKWPGIRQVFKLQWVKVDPPDKANNLLLTFRFWRRALELPTWIRLQPHSRGQSNTTEAKKERKRPTCT